MAEYIEREALKSQIAENKLMAREPAAKRILAMIDDMTAADVAPVIHAHWVYNPNGTDWNLGAWECSVCKCNNHNIPANENYNPYSFVGSRYCPNCGAKMDEEAQNDP